MNEVEITLVSSGEEVQQILELQRMNLPVILDEKEILEQGFVTVQHDPEVLLAMNQSSPAAIAKHHNRVVGYALVMTTNFRYMVPILEPMFKMIDEFIYDNKPLSSYRYFIMGQVCIAKDFRGIGLVDLLYNELRNRLSKKYELLITEVATRNQRSVRAHQRVGLKAVYSYVDPHGESWELMVWDWRIKK